MPDMTGGVTKNTDANNNPGPDTGQAEEQSTATDEAEASRECPDNATEGEANA
jgi:hypothetical protein